ncbi:NUDIX hydrolase [Candidatus Poribacteria bacterium]|nr:NUDIX hydrolase [Candidatus Poribacteria bacterium]
MDDFKVTESKQVYSGRVVTLSVETIILPGGVKTVREAVHHRGAAAIVPMISGDELLLIRQFRYCAGKTLWEIPAGTLEPGEQPIACAMRELIEETGYRAGKMRPIGGFYASPGFCDEFIHLFVATNLELCDSGPEGKDNDEQIEVHRVSLEDALGKIENGDIVDGKTIVSLMKVSSMIRGSGTT